MVKKGFTLAETLVVMAIISILFSVAAKVITTKPKPKKQTVSHGYFECYYVDGSLFQRTVVNGVESEPKAMGNECIFTPPSGVAFFNINSHNPDISNFEPNINNTLYVTIANVITLRNSRGETYDLVPDAQSGNNALTYFKTIYPDSQIYNNGNMRIGVMFSW